MNDNRRLSPSAPVPPRPGGVASAPPQPGRAAAGARRPGLLAVGLLAGLLTAAALAAGAAEPDAPAEPPAAPAAATAAQLLPNGTQPLPGVLTGGAPRAADGFAALAAAGYRTYVDLRPVTESGEEAELAATAAGLAYVRVPVAGVADLDLVSARALDAVLDDRAAAPVVVACASGNRSGALLALRAFWLEGVPPGEALELGRRAGLTGLEDTVRTLLGLPEAARP